MAEHCQSEYSLKTVWSVRNRSALVENRADETKINTPNFAEHNFDSLAQMSNERFARDRLICLREPVRHHWFEQIRDAISQKAKDFLLRNSLQLECGA
jgi:hypothetical protein